MKISLFTVLISTFPSVIKEEPITNNNLNSKDIPFEIDSNHIAIENNLSDAAFSDDDEEQVPNSKFLIIPPAKRSFRGVYCFQPVRDCVIP